MKALVVCGFWVVMSTAVPVAWASTDPAPNAVRTVLRFDKTECSDSAPFSALGANYFTNSLAFEEALAGVLAACKVDVPVGSNVVVLFTASPTLGAEAPSVIRAMYQRMGPTTWRRVGGMLGVSDATWLFVTDDVCDSVKAEILASRIEHPAVAQIGPFAAALLGAFPGHLHTIVGVAGPNPPCTLTKRTYAFKAKGDLTYKRSSINETVYIQRIHRNRDRTGYLTPRDAETANVADAAWVQLSGSSSFANTPLTRFTFNAGAAIFTGPTGGARQMTIDSGKFVSDPTPRAATLAGVTWHKSFDGTTAEPTPREKHGLFTGAVLTPAAGIAVAYTYGWRGFSLLGGFGAIWVKSAPDDDRVNTAVNADEGLLLRPAYGLIFGGSYAFGS